MKEMIKQHTLFALPNKKNSGFTLLELMVVLVVVCIIALWAVPSYSDYVRRSQARAAAQDMVSSLQLARSQAITTGRNVEICAANAGGTGCSGGNYGNRWLLHVPNDNGTGTLRVIQVYEVSGIDIGIGTNGRGNAPIRVNAQGRYDPTQVRIVPGTGGEDLGKTITLSGWGMEVRDGT